MTTVSKMRLSIDRSDSGLLQRFWSKVAVGPLPACWEWTACRTVAGYGRFGVRPTDTRNAHQVAYELLRGPVPPGLELDHLCRNRGCVNPAHLDPVTTRENLLRGVGASARNARKTHCVHGHELAGSNLLVNSRGDRVCRRCAYLRNRACEARRKEAA